MGKTSKDVLSALANDVKREEIRVMVEDDPSAKKRAKSKLEHKKKVLERFRLICSGRAERAVEKAKGIEVR